MSNNANYYILCNKHAMGVYVMSKHNSNDNRYDTHLSVNNPSLNPNWKTSSAKKYPSQKKLSATLVQLIPVGLVIAGILYFVFL